MKRDLVRASLRWQFGCVLIILVAIAGGCGPTPAPAEDYQNVAAIDLALCLQADAPAVPLPSPAKCARCNGTGTITQGDGHKTPCPLCNSGQAGLTLYVPASATIANRAPVPDFDTSTASPCARGQCPLSSRTQQTVTSGQQQATTSKSIVITRRGLLARWRR